MLGVEQRHRAVLHLVDDRRVGRADQGRVHLVRGGGERAADDLGRDRVDLHGRSSPFTAPFRPRSTSEPKGSTRSVAPGGTTVVAVGSETIAGPSTTLPTGRSSRWIICRRLRAAAECHLGGRRRVRRASPLRRGAPGRCGPRSPSAIERTTTNSTGAPGLAWPKRVSCAAWKRSETAWSKSGSSGSSALSQRDRQRVLLADVADVDGVRDAPGLAGDAFVLERGEAFALQLAERARQIGVVERGERGVVGAAEVLADLRLQHAPGGEGAGEAAARSPRGSPAPAPGRRRASARRRRRRRGRSRAARCPSRR